MVWRTSWKPFPRICIWYLSIISHSGRLTTGRLSGSGMRLPPTFTCRGHTWDHLEGEGGSHDMEGKLNIASGSTGGRCGHHHQHCRPPHHLVFRGGGGGKGAAWGPPQDAGPSVALAAVAGGLRMVVGSKPREEAFCTGAEEWKP